VSGAVSFAEFALDCQEAYTMASMVPDWRQRVWEACRLPLGFAALGVGVVIYRATVLGQTRFTGMGLSLLFVISLYLLGAIAIGFVVFLSSGWVTSAARAAVVGFLTAAGLLGVLVVILADKPPSLWWVIMCMTIFGIFPGAVIGAMAFWKPPNGK
jgi:hypothetical protein